MSIKVYQPHDKFLKRMLSDIEIAKSLMHSYVGPEMERRVDWESVQLTNKSFISQELEQFHSDVIYKCTLDLDNKQAYIYNLIEHQSTPDERLPFRILGYNVQLMEQHLNEGNKKLPIIINVCIYAGQESPYPYSTDIFDYFELPDLAREKMFKPIDLTDLTLLSQEELLKDETAGLVKVLLKQGIKRDYLNWIKNNRELIIKLVTSTFGISSIIYILGTDDVNEPKELLNAIVESSPEQKQIIMTAALKLQQEGRQEGIREGVHTKAIDMANNMIRKGFDLNTIQELTGLSKEELEKLK
jgi:predicted transposase/invertase (TIGR01784 family)